MLVTPYYNRPTQAGLYQHFATVAKAVAVPIILYNVPGRTGCDLKPATVIKLSKIENIIGIKEATGDLTRVRTLKEHCPDDFLLLSGDDLTACSFIQHGGRGVISVTANIVPQAMQHMVDTAIHNNYELSNKLQSKLLPLHKAMVCQSNPIPVKWAMFALGLLDSPSLRLPLTELESSYKNYVETALKEYGSLKNVTPDDVKTKDDIKI